MSELRDQLQASVALDRYSVALDIEPPLRPDACMVLLVRNGVCLHSLISPEKAELIEDIITRELSRAGRA